MNTIDEAKQNKIRCLMIWVFLKSIESLPKVEGFPNNFFTIFETSLNDFKVCGELLNFVKLPKVVLKHLLVYSAEYNLFYWGLPSTFTDYQRHDHFHNLQKGTFKNVLI